MGPIDFKQGQGVIEEPPLTVLSEALQMFTERVNAANPYWKDFFPE